MLDPAEHPHRRRNLLTGDWVLVSPHRAKRPWQGDTTPPAPPASSSYDPECHLCPGNERANGERNPDYAGPFVFANDFAALLPAPPAPPTGDPLFPAARARGEARVICFSPDHAATLPDLEDRGRSGRAACRIDPRLSRSRLFPRSARRRRVSDLYRERAGGPRRARRRRGPGADRWRAGDAAAPPLIDATGTNSELERPHVVVRDGRYYLFWSTQRRRFAPGSTAPTGLYAMVADRIEGPWLPVNGSGLVAANPEAAPYQAYCWWVTGEGAVLSFVDYGGMGDPQAAAVAERRARFGGTPAPFFRLAFAGDRVRVA